MRRISLAACLIFVTATFGSAQSAGPYTYAVGDTWTTTLGEIRVVKADDNGFVTVRPNSPCPTCLWVQDKDLTLSQVLEADGKPADPGKFGPLNLGLKFYQFPLEVKKAWRVEGHVLFRGSNEPIVIECWVAAFEEVKTKAGTFKAYRIDRDWKVRVSSGSPPSWKDTVWFAPEIKNIIKFESSSRNFRGWELVSYKLNP